MGSKPRIATVNLAVQVGGEDADRITHKEVSKLRKSLARYCVGPYSREVIEFAPILRIDGDIQQFNFEGVERVRRNKKDKYITGDVGIPRRAWQSRTFRKYLVDGVRRALLTFIHRLQRDKVDVDSERIMQDFERAADAYFGRRKRPSR